MRKLNIFNLRFPFVLAFFLLLFFYFRGGSLTKVEFKFNNVTENTEIFIDNNKLGNFSFIGIPGGKIDISVIFFETFTPKEIKQKVSRFYVNSGGIKSISRDAFSFSNINELKGKTIGVEIRNLEQAGIHLNFGNNEKYSVYLRPLRENDWALAKTENGKETFLKISNNVPLNAWQQLKKIGIIMTEPFPFLALFMIFVYLFRKKGKAFEAFGSPVKINTRFFWVLITVGFLLSFSWFFYLNQHFIEGIPHVGDAVSYLLQGKFLAEGKICGAPKIPQELFDFFKGWGPLSFKNGQWCGYYPYGHPLMLAFGVLVGIPGIIPPLLAAFSVIFLFLIGRKTGNLEIGIFAGLIMFISPFFQMNAASFMSHNTAVFFETSGLYFFIKGVMEKKKNLLFVAGIFFGLLFNTRPFTAVSIAAPLIVYLLISKVKFTSILLFCTSWLFFSLTYFLYNYLSSGTLWTTPYLQNSMGLFTQGKNFWVNYILVIQTHLITFLETFHGWPFLISTFLFFFSFFKIKTKEILLFILSVIMIILAWGFFDGGTYAITYGPRYWFEIIPFVSLTFSFSLYFLSSLAQNKLFKLTVYAIFIGLLCFTFLGWVRGKPVLWNNIGFTPSKISELKSFNSVDAKLIKKAKDLGIKNSVIFVKECGGWWCYGSVLPQNNPKLNSNIVWATDLGERNKELMAFFKGRNFYLADYDSNEINVLK